MAKRAWPNDRTTTPVWCGVVWVRRDLPALMSLAVSCTNDSYRVQALRVLKNWLARNPRYHDHPLLSAPEFTQGLLLPSSVSACAARALVPPPNHPQFLTRHNALGGGLQKSTPWTTSRNCTTG